MTGRPLGFYFLTPVWGAAYTKLYVDTVIPAQLSPGNLPVFKDTPNCRYFIYTRREDDETIRASAIFKELDATVPVTFEWIPDQIGVVHNLMTDCFRRGIAAAEKTDAAALLMTPDLVFADGSFKTIKRLSEEGRDVIFIPSIRTVKNSADATLHASFKSGNIICVPPRQLMQIALDNLHPLAHSAWWEEGDGGLIPATIYWRVDNEGIVAHCFHLHPILVHAQHKDVKFFGTVDDDYIMAACPDATKDALVTDSDDVLAIDLSDPWRYFEMRFAKGSIRDTVRWAEQFANPRHHNLFASTIRMHVGISHPERWKGVEGRAQPIVDEIMTRLNWPVSKLLFDADLIPRRAVRWTKGFRLRLANPHLAGRADGKALAWHGLLLSVLNTFRALRGSLVKMMQWLAARIEYLAALPYNLVLDRHLAKLIAPTDDVVLASNSPEKLFVEPWFAHHVRRFARGRYVTVARPDAAVFLENGQHIPDGSKAMVLLELDAFRSDDITCYLKESRRVLQDGGKLIVYTHRLSLPTIGRAVEAVSDAKLLVLLSTGFAVNTRLEQGGLGTLFRVKLQNWVREMINRRLDLRGLLIIFSLPLLPIVALLGGFVILGNAILDLFDRSKRFSVSSLIFARKAKLAALPQGSSALRSNATAP